jgi:hypothetical protein
MLMDLAKYFATITGGGSLAAGERLNWWLALAGFGMAAFCWAVGVITIPKDKEEDR